MKILVVGPSWVGDMVMAQGLFMWLKKNVANLTLDVLSVPSCAPVLKRMPEVDHCIEADLRHGKLQLLEHIKIGRSLRGRYDKSILLRNSFKHSLIPRIARIPSIVTRKHLKGKTIPSTHKQFITLGLGKGEQVEDYESYNPCLIRDKESESCVAKKFSLELKRPVIALCPGAEFGPSKRWPAKHFAECAEVYLSQNKQVWLLGSKKDAQVAEEINQRVKGRCINFAGKTELLEAIDLLAMADAVIANDSGLMHIAAALNKSLVAIYGSTFEGKAPPLSKKAHSVFVDLPCRPCRKRVCPLNHYYCLTMIESKRVVEKITV